MSTAREILLRCLRALAWTLLTFFVVMFLGVLGRLLAETYPFSGLLFLVGMFVWFYRVDSGLYVVVTTKSYED